MEFTDKMRREFTILVPEMLPMHFKLGRRMLEKYGYNIELLNEMNADVVEQGLKYVHNDACYPAVLVIGQVIHALNSGRYDLKKTAVLLSQTGGGCRASNYISLLNKALARAGYDLPVLSVCLKKTGDANRLKLKPAMLRDVLCAVFYGDFIDLLLNQTQPYEVFKGSGDSLAMEWVERLTASDFKLSIKHKHMRKTFEQIARDFSNIEVKRTKKNKVGIVGEIYVKYASFANNDLKKYLLTQNCEVMVPGLIGFLQYCIENQTINRELYGGGFFTAKGARWVMNKLERHEIMVEQVLKPYPEYTPPSKFSHKKELIRGIIGHGNKMGEGWLLTAEIAELVTLGYPNIVSVQPFGCLPNHICAKGMARKLRQSYPAANIVAVDYDPGASVVNQENRIKLMLSVESDKQTQPQSIHSRHKEIL